MGITCEISTANREQHQFLRWEQLRPFGRVRVIRDTRLNRIVAAKEIYLASQIELDDYLKTAALSKQSTRLIPTLLKLNHFQQLRRPNCMHSIVQIEFDYVRLNLASQLQLRKQRLSKFIAEKRWTMQLFQMDKIKLNDYHKINKLSQTERSYINLHYFESDILRMIDHVAGSIYYLLSYEYQHGGIRPENILVDEEDRYLLVDRKLFMLDSNYELGMKDHADRIYMSPQEFKSLRERQQFPSKSPELSQIFSIGLMALQMANLNDTIDQIYDFSCWRANVYELNRLLAQTKMRYSDELTSILQRMLFFDESHRIDMNQLIDLLTPVLEANLEQWEAIFSVADKHSVSSSDQQILPQPQPRSKDTYNLLTRLSEIEEQYHRVMSNKILNEGRFICEESLRKDEERIINKLRETRETVSSNKKTREAQLQQPLAYHHL